MYVHMCKEGEWESFDQPPSKYKKVGKKFGDVAAAAPVLSNRVQLFWKPVSSLFESKHKE